MKLPNLNHLNIKKISFFLFSLSAWFGLKPYYAVNHNFLISLFIYFSFLLFIIFVKFSKKQFDFFFGIFYLLIIIYFLLPGKDSLDQSLSLGFLSISLICFLQKKERIILFNLFRNIFIVTLFPSLFIYFLDIIGLNIDYQTISGFKENSQIGYNFLAFMGNVKTTVYESLPLYRFQGMYDEPGLVGTISGLLLVLDNFNFKKKNNYILMISGFFSFSMAFYLLTLLYIILSLKKKFRTIIFILLLFFLIASFTITRYYIINKFIYINTEHRFKFDNRASASFNTMYTQKFKNGYFEDKLFGFGKDANEKYGGNVSSYKSLIYNKGYLGFTALIFFYFFYSKHFIKKRNNRILILIFLTSIYQRPDVITLFHSILFIGGVSVLSQIEMNDTILLSKNTPSQ